MPTYTGIASEAFKHPLDRQAEQALRSFPGFDVVAKTFIKYLKERPEQIFLLGNTIKVGPRQYSTLYSIFRECIKDLDIYPIPTFYVSQNPAVNCYALGQEMPYIVMNTGLIELFDEEQLRVVLAHELGHIKCEHTILIQMALWAMGAANILGELTLGIGDLLSTGLILAFFEWRRKAELSADRAALLVTDNLEQVMGTMMGLAGGTHKYGHECSLPEFINQSKEYQDLNQDGLNQVYKFLIYNGGRNGFLEHPFAVERLKFIQEWANSKEYVTIKSGTYARAGKQGSVEVPGEEVTTDATSDEVDELQSQVEKLQQEINRLRNRDR